MLYSIRHRATKHTTTVSEDDLSTAGTSRVEDHDRSGHYFQRPGPPLFRRRQLSSCAWIVAAAAAAAVGVWILRERSVFFDRGAVVGPKMKDRTDTISALHAKNGCRYLVQSAKDIRACYPAQFVKQFNTSPKTQQTSNCTDILSWGDVQHCLTGRYRYPNEAKKYDYVNTPSSTTSFQSSSTSSTSYMKSTTSSIREIHILGERHSGTKFITNAIQQCYPKETASLSLNEFHKNMTTTTVTPNIRVHRDFLRSKHFFQPVVPGDFSTSLIVVIVRDPVEWMAAMVEKPYHSPHHMAGFDHVTMAVQPLPWQEFVARPWTASAAAAATLQAKTATLHGPAMAAMMTYDFISLGQQHQDKNSSSGDNSDHVRCQGRFSWHEVVPCRLDNVTGAKPPWNIPPQKWRGFAPVYEQRRQRIPLSRDGNDLRILLPQPYDHLLQLRADKIINWILELPLLMKLGGFVVVRYEDLLREGNALLLEQIHSIVRGSEDGDGSRLPSSCKVTGPQPERLSRRYIPNDLIKWVNNNIDVATEKLIGYR